MSDLQTVEATRDVSAAPASKTARHYLDFEVDGERLGPRIQQVGYDLISCLWSDSGQATEPSIAAAERLLGLQSADAPADRVSVYVCGECGDLGCGALTVQLDLADDHVQWTDWGYQNNYDDEIHPLVGLPWLGDVSFPRPPYESVLHAAILRIRGGATSAL